MRASGSDVSADRKAFWRKNLGGGDGTQKYFGEKIGLGNSPPPPTPRWGPAGGVLVRWCTSTVVHRDVIQAPPGWTPGGMTIPENVLRELWVGKDRGFLPFALSYYADRRAGSGAQTRDHVHCRCTSTVLIGANKTPVNDDGGCVVLIVEVIGCRSTPSADGAP